MDFNDYVGRSVRTSGRILAAPMETMAALLDRRFNAMAPTGAVPPLWHWMILQEPVLQSEIGHDGHPKRGGLIPPIPYPRRMFAGSRTRFAEPLFIGDEVERTTTIKSITPKSGRSGNLVFVTLSHVVQGSRGASVMEEQDLVYRELAPNAPTLQSTADAGGREKPSDFTVVETVLPDPVLLFRFSMATANTHRIHYDVDYVRNEEGYPNLVVHGPLLAILLADLGTRHLQRSLTAFEFRAVKPTFAGSPFYCVARDDGDKVLLQTLDAVHDQCMIASAQ